MAHVGPGLRPGQAEPSSARFCFRGLNLSRRDQRFADHFHLSELFDSLAPQSAEHIAEQWPVTPSYFLKFHAHAEALDEILHPRFQRDTHVEHTQHQPEEIGAGAQCTRSP